MNWLRKLLNKLYEEEETVIEYNFLKGEISKIVSDFVIYDRKIIDLEKFEIKGTKLMGNKLEIYIKPKKFNIPPPGPPEISTIKEDIVDSEPKQSSLN
jgi:hypothetical protein